MMALEWADTPEEWDHIEACLQHAHDTRDDQVADAHDPWPVTVEPIPWVAALVDPWLTPTKETP